jgi:hypothetical protein
MWPEPPIADPVLIQMIGVEAAKSPRRTERSHPVRLYGHRVNDVAKRLVGVEVPVTIGTEILIEFNKTKEFPIIEVPHKSWFYVGRLGTDEALIQSGNEVTDA